MHKGEDRQRKESHLVQVRYGKVEQERSLRA